MSFDLAALSAAVAAHGPMARVVIAAFRGSSPREVGAAMLVWDGGQFGTIGGGALEHAAAQAARAGHQGISRHALGPDLGQCCGGAVTLLTERFDKQNLPRPAAHGVFARSVGASVGDAPLAVRRLLTRARDRGDIPGPALIEGWMVEPAATPKRPVWIWGAGHVGRAITGVLAPLPDLALSWVDTGADRFPDLRPEGVDVLAVVNPADLVPHAPTNAAHLIVTYSHALDLDLCHALLTHDFGFAGLIGSATKWARFRSRLAGLGHPPGDITRLTCPIGDPQLGKHPQAIAIGVARQILALDAIKSHSRRRA